MIVLKRTVEVGQHVLALDILADEAHVAERLVLILVEVGQRHLEHATLEALGGDLGALSAVHQGLADLANLEHGRRLDVIPILAGEGIHAARVCKGMSKWALPFGLGSASH